MCLSWGVILELCCYKLSMFKEHLSSACILCGSLMKCRFKAWLMKWCWRCCCFQSRLAVLACSAERLWLAAETSAQWRWLGWELWVVWAETVCASRTITSGSDCVGAACTDGCPVSTLIYSMSMLILKAWFRKVKQLKHVYVREQSWFQKIV